MNKECTYSGKVCQEWPSEGQLSEKMNLEIDELTSKLKDQSGETHRYIVKSIRNEHFKLAPAKQFTQTDSGPNFQGDLITQCTCRPDLRSRHIFSEWEGKWIVGFTSKKLGRHYLFYLMKILKAFQSQAEIWKYLPPHVRNAKSSRYHVCGDLFEPRLDKIVRKEDEWDPEKYYNPIEDHAHADCGNPKRWHRDICYPVDASANRQCFLIGDVTFSFLWSKPKICHKGDLTPPRNLEILKCVQDLIPDLVGV